MTTQCNCDVAPCLHNPEVLEEILRETSSKYHFDKLSEWQKEYVVAILKDMNANLKLDYETRVGKAIRTILTGEVTDE